MFGAPSNQSSSRADPWAWRPRVMLSGLRWSRAVVANDNYSSPENAGAA